MKILRFFYRKKAYWGVVKNRYVFFLKGSPFFRIQPTSRKIALKNMRILPPVNPGKIVLAGLNYKDHARELNMEIPREPVIFIKPSTAVVAHNDVIIYPEGVNRLDYEAELAVVIKRKGKDIKPLEVKKYIFGYTCLNDVTARDLQKRDGQWTRAKSFDTFCPVGPWIETEFDPDNARVQTYLNGKLKQDSNTSNFIFSVPYLISFVSAIMTLNPGDIISTGTPSGVGPMRRGDRIETVISGLGTLKNRVK